jgi:hypothetical protein
MRYILVTGALSAALMIGSSAAFAQEPTEDLCRNVDAQVGSALENTSSTNRDEALRERNSGRNFCDHGYYKIGTEHLEQALKLLGTKT